MMLFIYFNNDDDDDEWQWWWEVIRGMGNMDKGAQLPFDVGLWALADQDYDAYLYFYSPLFFWSQSNKKEGI